MKKQTKKKTVQKSVSPVALAALGVVAAGAVVAALSPEGAMLLLLVPVEGVYLLRKRLGLLPPVKVDTSGPRLPVIEGAPVRYV